MLQYFDHAELPFASPAFVLGSNQSSNWVDPRTGLDALKKRKFLVSERKMLRRITGPMKENNTWRITYNNILHNII
jgi:hypothetical protein